MLADEISNDDNASKTLPASIHTCPAEILLAIVNLVPNENDSLKEFSLTSWRIRHIASESLFSKIRLRENYSKNEKGDSIDGRPLRQRQSPTYDFLTAYANWKENLGSSCCRSTTFFHTVKSIRIQYDVGLKEVRKGRDLLSMAASRSLARDSQSRLNSSLHMEKLRTVELALTNSKSTRYGDRTEEMDLARYTLQFAELFFSAGDLGTSPFKVCVRESHDDHITFTIQETPLSTGSKRQYDLQTSFGTKSAIDENSWLGHTIAYFEHRLKGKYTSHTVTKALITEDDLAEARLEYTGHDLSRKSGVPVAEFVAAKMGDE